MRSGFFDSNITGYDDQGMPVFDRAENAEFIAKYFSSFIGNGVYAEPSTNFQVVADSGMAVKAKLGAVFINGYYGFEENETSFNLEQSSTLQNRIDRIVARLNYTNRKIELAVVKGTEAATPTAPALTRDINAYELALADVYIGKNATAITQANITDQRANAQLCGFVSGVVSQIDTTDLFAQFTAAWNEWFEAIKGQLTEDQATNLYNMITELSARVDVIEAQKYADVTFYVSTTGNDITGDGSETAPFASVNHALQQRPIYCGRLYIYVYPGTYNESIVMWGADHTWLFAQDETQKPSFQSIEVYESYDVRVCNFKFTSCTNPVEAGDAAALCYSSQMTFDSCELRPSTMAIGIVGYQNSILLVKNSVFSGVNIAHYAYLGAHLYARNSSGSAEIPYAANGSIIWKLGSNMSATGAGSTTSNGGEIRE